MSGLIARYEAVRRAVDAAAVAAGRDPASVRLLAVSKTFPASAIRELYDYGVRAFGENRVPELEAKAAELPADIEWHLIGQLQANKVRRAVRLAAYIHSVDSAALLERIDRIAGEEGRCPKIFIEVNSGEASKSGCDAATALELARRAAALSHLRPVGLMTMAPAAAPEPELRRVFGALAEMRARLRAEGLDLPELSMGMSGDFAAAVAAGATWVRIGSAIFGQR